MPEEQSLLEAVWRQESATVVGLEVGEVWENMGAWESGEWGVRALRGQRRRSRIGFITTSQKTLIISLKQLNRISKLVSIY